jgi:hypothetical protein
LPRRRAHSSIPTVAPGIAPAPRIGHSASKRGRALVSEGASTRASGSARRTRCSPRSAPTRLPSAPSANWRRRARRCAGERRRQATSSLPRRPRSRASPPTGTRTRRSVPSPSSARGPSSTTCARCSASSTSARAGALRCAGLRLTPPDGGAPAQRHRRAAARAPRARRSARPRGTRRAGARAWWDRPPGAHRRTSDGGRA